MKAPGGLGLADYKFTKLPLVKISIFSARNASFLTSVQKPIWLWTDADFRGKCWCQRGHCWIFPCTVLFLQRNQAVQLWKWKVGCYHQKKNQNQSHQNLRKLRYRIIFSQWLMILKDNALRKIPTRSLTIWLICIQSGIKIIFTCVKNSNQNIQTDWQMNLKRNLWGWNSQEKISLNFHTSGTRDNGFWWRMVLLWRIAETWYYQIPIFDLCFNTTFNCVFWWNWKLKTDVQIPGLIVEELNKYWLWKLQSEIV